MAIRRNKPYNGCRIVFVFVFWLKCWNCCWFPFLVPSALYLQQSGARICHFAYLLHFCMVTLHFASYLLHLAMRAFHFAWYLPHFGTSELLQLVEEVFQASLKCKDTRTGTSD